MANDELGQVFTPAEICELMVSKLPANLDSRILEPCFGAGAFLHALKNANYRNVIGYEIDAELFSSVSVQYPYKFACCDFLAAEINEKYDGIIMNPPYIRHEAFKNLRKYGVNIKTLRRHEPFKSLPARSNLYAYFIAKCYSLLTEHGVIVAIIPSAWTGQKSYLASFIHGVGGQIERLPLEGLPFGRDVLTSADIVLIRRGSNSTGVVKTHLASQIPTNHIVASSLCKIRRGLTTGLNDFFINNEELLSFSKPILSSPRSIKLFRFDKPSSNVVAIIPKGIESPTVASQEREIVLNGKPVTLAEKIKNGDCWYSLKPIVAKKGNLVFSYIIRDRMRFIWCQEKTIIKDNFYLIDGDDPYLLMALFNNFYVYDQLELAGKNYGGGMLKIQTYDLKKLSLIDPSILSENDKNKLREFGKRLVKSKSVEESNGILDESSSFLSAWEGLSLEVIKLRYNEHRKKRLEMRNE